MVTTPFPNITLPFTEQRSTPGGFITQPWLQLLRILWARTGAAQGGNAVPTGLMADFGGTVAPDGWLVCDGGTVNRVEFAALFSVIGTNFGAGDGSTTFNLPPGNVFYQGAGNLTVGTMGGNASATLSVTNLPSHTHGVTDPGHHHTAAVVAGALTSGNATGSAVSGNTSTATTGLTINATGNGTPFSILPPYALTLKIIKT